MKNMIAGMIIPDSNQDEILKNNFLVEKNELIYFFRNVIQKNQKVKF